MTSQAILDRYDELLLDLHAEGLTREKWDSLIERVEVLAEEADLWDMLSAFLRVGGGHGWKHPRYD